VSGPRLVAVSHGAPLKRSIRVGPAEIAYLEGGDPSAPPVVLLHGFPTHSFLWRHVVHELGDEFRSLAPDLLGLGDTVVSPYEDFSAPMQAEVLVDWLDRLGLDEVALVAHAHGGAVAHQLLAHVPDRVSHLALVDVVAYDNWPTTYWSELGRLAGTGVLDAVARATGVPRRLHSIRLGLAAAAHERGAVAAEALDEHLRPLRDPAGREAARRFVLAGRATYTLECADALRRFTRPSLVVWGADDVVLSPSWGMRLADDLPGAPPLALVPFCGHLVPEERPAELATLLRELLARDP
jgi:haloalkane dehalogenase